jgi:ABC-2 type transport system ATP-binding protein
VLLAVRCCLPVIAPALFIGYKLMANIQLHQVSVEFPIYNVSARFVKKSFLRIATGGHVLKDEAHKLVTVRSLDNVSLSLQHGDRIGLIGHNGAGKSTLLRLLAKVYEPTQGYIKINGQVSAMLDLMQGMESESSGHENIIMRGILMGLTRKQITQQVDEIAELTGLGDYLAMPIRTYSAGMLTRLAFAISTSICSDILLIDEVFATGDTEFIKKAQDRMISLVNQSSIMVMANHSDDLLREFCTKGLVLEAGAVQYFGPMDEALERYHAKRTN